MERRPLRTSDWTAWRVLGFGLGGLAAFFFCGSAISVALITRSSIAVLIAFIVCGAFFALAIRWYRCGTWATEAGLQVRMLTSEVRVRWGEIRDIHLEKRVAGWYFYPTMRIYRSRAVVELASGQSIPLDSIMYSDGVGRAARATKQAADEHIEYIRAQLARTA